VAAAALGVAGRAARRHRRQLAVLSPDDAIAAALSR
jgi:hypothetical protein